METSFTIFPLGDAALTIDLGNLIDEQLNQKAVRLQKSLLSRNWPGIKDIIVAYSTVTILYDAFQIREHPGKETTVPDPGPTCCREGAFACLARRVKVLWEQLDRLNNPILDPETPILDPETSILDPETSMLRIPVCYESPYGPDLDRLAEEKGLSREETIHLHTSNIYRVYMIGFLPGFPYLGKVDPALATPRKDRPVPVQAGGVGIAGNQTGIYPLNSPGGWQIIGRTPLTLFDPVAAVPVRLNIGQRVQFFSVSGKEFQELAYCP